MGDVHDQNRALNDAGYRAGSARTISTRLRLVSRVRIFDSVVIPAVPMVGLCAVAAIFVQQREVRFALLGFALAMAVLFGWMWIRFLRKCWLDCPFPHRTLHISLEGRNPVRIELEQIVGVATRIEMSNDTGIHHVVFELRDGTLVPLWDDINFFFDAPHAERLAEEVRAFLERAREAHRDTR